MQCEKASLLDAQPSPQNLSVYMDENLNNPIIYLLKF